MLRYGRAMHDITSLVQEIRQRIRATGLPYATISGEAQVGERTLHGFVLHNRVPSVRTLAKLQRWLATRDGQVRSSRIRAAQ